MSALSRYEEQLKVYPQRGSGLHQHIMSTACLGVIAEIPPRQIIEDMDTSFAKIKPREAHDAVEKASGMTLEKNDAQVFKPKKPVVRSLDDFIGDQPQDEAALFDLSPVYLCDIDDDATTLLNTLYEPDEYLFIGDVYDTEVKTVAEWLKTGLNFPHIIPNPMTGAEGTTGTGKPSMRCEQTVADLRYAVCEMDGVELGKQVAFWLECIRIGIPVEAIIHSGGKSLHGWVRVDCGTDTEKWEKDVKGWLFGEFGIPYGFDPACSNKARLSRLPGFVREGKERQRLLYLRARS